MSIKMTTIQIPEAFKDQFQDATVTTLLGMIEKQKQEIDNYRNRLSKFTNPDAVVRKRHQRRRQYKTPYHAQFAPFLAKAPETVRAAARKLRDEEGYKAAVEFLRAWWKENRVVPYHGSIGE